MKRRLYFLIAYKITNKKKQNLYENTSFIFGW